jgi:hypothetical protein
VNNWKKGRPLWNKQKEYPEYLVFKTETGISVSLLLQWLNRQTFLRSFTNMVKLKSIWYRNFHLPRIIRRSLYSWWSDLLSGSGCEPKFTANRTKVNDLVRFSVLNRWPGDKHGGTKHIRHGHYDKHSGAQSQNFVCIVWKTVVFRWWTNWKPWFCKTYFIW